tara:strand:+ start:382 stop:900 length:519 start_codon:yes stop_codon:yes gene_type:complete
MKFPKKKYNIIYADPPWNIKTGPGWNSNGKARDLIYPTMSLEEISNLPVKNIADDKCRLFIWTINKYLGDTFKIIKDWGFKYSTTIVWCKNPNGIGLGGTFSMTNEYLLFAYKGKVDNKARLDTTWFLEKRGPHSKKPEKFREVIEHCFDGSKIELFARHKTPDWDVWGNEI